MAGRTTDMDFSDKTFLIIDDFEGMCSMLRDILRGCGANLNAIETAPNGGAAIGLLERRKFDIVLCDLNLGPGRNGQQVLEEAKFRDCAELPTK